MKTTIAVFQLLAVLALPCKARAAGINSGPGATQLAVGEMVPNIVLPSLKDGRPVSLGQFRGKKLILHIFASW